MSDIKETYMMASECISQTVLQAVQNYAGPVLIANVVLRAILAFTPSSFPTVFVGLALIYFHFAEHVELAHAFVALTLIGAYITLRSLRGAGGKATWIFAIVVIIVNESLAFTDQRYMKLRPVLMLLVMKLVSVRDYFLEHVRKNRGGAKLPLLDIVAYLVHPGSVIMGCWHPPFAPLASQVFPLFKVLSCWFYATTCLLLSTCIIQMTLVEWINNWMDPFCSMYLPETAADILVIFAYAYTTALQFRTSHYFICFLTESFFAFWNNDTKVTRPIDVELPRSLVSVVVSWNIPMHIWLKQYVFKPTKQKYGGLFAVLATYALSSFIHGLNFQIASVLLTLGILTWLEFKLRGKIADIYSACVESRACNKVEDNSSVCARGHVNTPRKSLATSFTNAAFALLAIAHLAYLGATFDGQEESSFASNVMMVWSSLGFYSHIIAVITALIYVAI